MPDAKLPIQPVLNSNQDAISIKGAFTEMINCYPDEFGNIKKRPGYSLFSTIAGNFNGAYYWTAKRVLICVYDGIIYSVDNAGTATEITGVTLSATERTYFADDGARLYLADGGRLAYTEGVTASYDETLEGATVSASPNISTVVFYDGYFVVTEKDTNYFYWSDRDGYDFGTSTAFERTRDFPDSILGVSAGWRELLIFGEHSIEFWYNDNASPMAHVSNLSLQVGCETFSSVVFTNNTWYFMDRERNFVVIDGRQPKVISQPIGKELSELSYVADVVGFKFDFEGEHFVGWNFRSANKTFVYNLMTGVWSEFAYWNLDTGKWDNYKGTYITYAHEWNKTLLFSETGNVYLMDGNTHQDAGSPIRMVLRTDYIDYGTNKTKRSNNVLLRLERGEKPLSDSGEHTVALRFRDNGTYEWGNDIEVKLGESADRYMYAYIRRLGVYRSRQWEVEHTENSPFTLVDFEERLEVLGR